jgi:hypothetical protein
MSPVLCVSAGVPVVFGVLTCDTMEQVSPQPLLQSDAVLMLWPTACALVLCCSAVSASHLYSSDLPAFAVLTKGFGCSTQESTIHLPVCIHDLDARQHDASVAAAAPKLPVAELLSALLLCITSTAAGAGPCWWQGRQQGWGGSHHCNRDG